MTWHAITWQVTVGDSPYTTVTATIPEKVHEHFISALANDPPAGGMEPRELAQLWIDIMSLWDNKNIITISISLEATYYLESVAEACSDDFELSILAEDDDEDSLLTETEKLTLTDNTGDQTLLCTDIFCLLTTPVIVDKLVSFTHSYNTCLKA